MKLELVMTADGKSAHPLRLYEFPLKQFSYKVTDWIAAALLDPPETDENSATDLAANIENRCAAFCKAFAMYNEASRRENLGRQPWIVDNYNPVNERRETWFVFQAQAHPSECIFIVKGVG